MVEPTERRFVSAGALPTPATTSSLSCAFSAAPNARRWPAGAVAAKTSSPTNASQRLRLGLSRSRYSRATRTAAVRQVTRNLS